MTEKTQSKQMLWTRMLLPIVIVGCLATVQLSAQTKGYGPQSKPVPPTLPNLYRHFFAYQLHLDRKADELEKQGKNAQEFRTRYQKRIGLSDASYAALRTSARSLESKLAAKDAEAVKIIQAERQANAARVAAGGALPPVPDTLIQKQKERDGIINDEVTNFRSQLTSDERTRMDKFLNEDFSKAATVSQNVSLPPHVANSQLLKKGGKR